MKTNEITQEQQDYSHKALHNLLQWHKSVFHEALNDYIQVTEAIQEEPDKEKGHVMLAGALGVLFLRGALAEYSDPGVKKSCALASAPTKPANG